MNDKLIFDIVLNPITGTVNGTPFEIIFSKKEERPPEGKKDWDYSLVDNYASDSPHYADLLTALFNHERQYPNMYTSALSGDMYRIGRSFNTAITTLLAFVRKTGDRTVWNEVNLYMDLLAATITDHDNDGYTSIRWWMPGQESNTYWGTDIHPMDNILCHSLVAAYTWALIEANDPGDNARHDFWIDYLFNNFIPRWALREGNKNGLPFKDLTHPYTALVRLNYYLALIAGHIGEDTTQWSASASEYMQHLVETVFVEDGQNYTWDHRVPSYGHEPLGCQSAEYASLTMISLFDLYLEGYDIQLDMAKFANTWRDRVLTKDELGTVAYDVCGGGSTPVSKYLISFAPLLSYFDNSSLLLEQTNAMIKEGPYAGRNYIVPVANLLNE